MYYNLQPLRVIIGPCLIDFITKFTKDMEKLEIKESVEDSLTSMRSLPPFFSMVDIKSIKIKFDYATKVIDIEKLRNGKLYYLF